MSDLVTYRVLHARRMTARGYEWSWGAWSDTGLLLPVEVRDVIAPDVSAAKLELNLGAVHDHAWNWRRHCAPDDQVAVVSDHQRAVDRTVLFTGFIADADWTFDRSESVIVTAVAFPFRLAHDADQLVYGRWMPTMAGLGISPPDPANNGHFSGLPCTFNAGGRPNRTRLAIDSVVRATGTGTVYGFTADNDPAAGWWTFTQAAAYLMWFYNRDQTWVANYDSPWADQAFDPVVSAEVDGQGLWEALAAVAAQGGRDLTCTLTSAADGRVAAAMNFIRRGGGTEIVLDHQPPNADGSLPAFDAERTNLLAATVAEATASCVTAPIVAGGREIVEITVELGKAWDGALLDVGGGYIVQPGQENTDAANEYVKRFCVGGASFADYVAVGRLWDANTDGLFSGVPYGLAVTDVAAVAGKPAGSWPAMAYAARRLLTKLAWAPGVAGAETLLEYSLDSGATWHKLTDHKVMTGRLGVFLRATNLAGILPPGETDVIEGNFFRKLLDAGSGVKVRLTCGVASPNRAISAPGRRATGGTIFNQSAWFDRGAFGQVRSVAAPSRFAGGSLPADTAAGTADLTAAGLAVQTLNEDRFVEAQLVLEWIAPEVALGDRVGRIGGIEVDLRTNSGPARRAPRVIGRTFRLTPETWSTELTLDTERKSAVK